MIDRIAGTLVEVELTQVVVDVNGVGYAVVVPMSTYDKLPRVGERVKLLTHLHLREDLVQLYGFASLVERQLFNLLLTVTGIGPRLALNVLSCLPVASFCRAVADADLKALTRISGLGKKTAERLVLELRDRIAEIDPTAGLAPGGGTPPLPQQALDAMAALETLGFKADKARKTVEQLCHDLPAADCSAENLIRKALQALNA